jgi:hypothetical protein
MSFHQDVENYTKNSVKKDSQMVSKALGYICDRLPYLTLSINHSNRTIIIRGVN